MTSKQKKVFQTQAKRKEKKKRCSIESEICLLYFEKKKKGITEDALKILKERRLSSKSIFFEDMFDILHAHS